MHDPLEHDASETSSGPVRLAIFTDFDGTLVDIAPTPDAVSVPAELAHLLEQTQADLDSALAVLTGREIADVDKYLSPLTLPVAGTHGNERRRADGSLDAPDADRVAAAEAIAAALMPLLATHPELIVEQKPGSVALHYRQAPELERACRIALEEAVNEVDGFLVMPGKMVFEARPRGIDKGEALRAFMLEEPFAGRTPIFIGDDVTDEDGFRAAQDLGGVGIKLGPGVTSARMRIADIASVHALISGLGDIAQGRVSATRS